MPSARGWSPAAFSLRARYGVNLLAIRRSGRRVDERLNRAPQRNAPYVGESAFAHKGGLHVSAVEKDPRTYEHIEPQIVGNRRHIVVSDQSGRANILARFRDIGLDIDADDPKGAGERFADEFEKRFINQGSENRTIDESLNIAWSILSMLPKSELTRLANDQIDKYYGAPTFWANLRTSTS